MKSWWRKIIQQDFGENTYHLLSPSWYSGISAVVFCILISFGVTIICYSEIPECIKYTYTCGNRESVSFQIQVSNEFVDAGKPIGVYYGLSGFYSTYIGIRMSYSPTQIQASPRSPDYIPYSGCSSLSKLSDVTGESDVLLPVDFFATDPEWRNHFNVTEIMTKTLRPCGGLYYWTPTDQITISDLTGKVLSMNSGDISWDELNIPPEPKNQTFPFIDPITGEVVWADPSSDRMRAWARSNIHSTFMVKAGTLEEPLFQGVYTVSITQCRDMQSEKFIKLCTTTWIGYDQTFLSIVYFVVAGILAIALAAYFIIKPKQESIALFN